MTNKELEIEIAKKVREIQDLYYSEYPKGDHLHIVIFRHYMAINNCYFGNDSKFPINYFEVEAKDDLKEFFESCVK